MMSLAATRLRHAAIVLAAAVAALTAMTCVPAKAAPPRPNGYPVTNVNLRAGPSTEFPVIVTVPGRAPIAILGCLADYGWCDVFFQGNRGWMRSIYLAGWYQGYYYPLRDYAPQLRYPVVTFDIRGYWDANYRSRPFYADRARWGGPRQEGRVERTAFYDRLSPYGQWVWLEGQYVFVPGNVDRFWRPYTVGRWVYTDRYGWMWASNEPFGWATYHYGRWGFSKRIGWFWVPGSRWAPAWVSWRQSDDYLAWAPLPPASDEGVSVDVSVRNVPNYYWQAVPSNQFLAPDLPRRIVRDQAKMKPVLERMQPLANVTVNNTVVVNNAVTPQFVEEKTQEKVVVHKVERTRDAAKSGKVEGASVEIFQPDADQKPAVAAPPKPKKIEEVAAESKTKEQAGAAPATDSLLLPPEIKTPEAVQATPPAPPPAPAPPANEATPAAGEQAAPPPPPAAAGEAAPPPPPPPAGEAAPPPPPAPAEEAAPPPPPPAEETAPPPPAPPAAKEEAAPPPPAEEAAPPPAQEVVPPPAEAETPKAKPEGKHKKHEVAPPLPAGEEAPPPAAEETAPLPPPPPAPKEVAPPPPPPAEEAAPPPAPPPPAPAEETAPPPPATEAAPPPAPPPPAPEEVAPPPPPPPPPAEAAPPPPPPAEAAPPPAPAKEPAPCPEGTVRLDDGSCAPPPQ